MANEDGDYYPPPEPPPLLNEGQLVALARQGWVRAPLSELTLNSINALFEELCRFFDKSSEEKASLYPEKQRTEFGYYSVTGEKEYLSLRCNVHEDSELERRAAKVWSECGSFLHRILCDIALATGSSHMIWDNILDGTLTLPHSQKDISATLLRMFRYFPGSGTAGEHTDLGLLTLCVGGGRGLQVLDFSEEEPVWVDAEGPIVLTGQTLRALSDGMIRPGIHRVVVNPEGRHSVVFALRHSFKHPIDLDRFGGEGQVDPRELWKKLKVGILNVNAKAEIRAKQRATLDAQRLQLEKSGQG